jgi:hypothetical protein
MCWLGIQFMCPRSAVYLIRSRQILARKFLCVSLLVRMSGACLRGIRAKVPSFPSLGECKPSSKRYEYNASDYADADSSLSACAQK